MCEKTDANQGGNEGESGNLAEKKPNQTLPIILTMVAIFGIVLATGIFRSDTQWFPVLVGATGGGFGGLLLVVDRILERPVAEMTQSVDHAQTINLLGRALIGIFSGGVFVALTGVAVPIDVPRTCAIGFVSGFSGSILQLLAKRLEKALK